MIFEYLDGELPGEKEALLFTHLASCSKCRDEFKQQSLLKNEVQIHQKEVSDKFEKRVFDSIKSENNSFINRIVSKKVPAYFSYMLGGIIIIAVLLSLIQVGSLRTDLNNFKWKYELTLRQLKYQSTQPEISNIPAIRIVPSGHKL